MQIAHLRFVIGTVLCYIGCSVYLGPTYIPVVLKIFKAFELLTSPPWPWKPGIFRSLECLSYLDLRFNEFTTLPVAFLQGVGSAYYNGECGYDTDRVQDDRKVRIEVDGLNTSYLHPGGERRRRRYWHSPPEQSSLHLKHMDLTELPAGVFDGLEDLKELHLQGNRLRTLPKNVFRNLSGLRRLYLQNNGLEELPSSVWAWNTSRTFR